MGILRERGWNFHTESSGWRKQDYGFKVLTGHSDHLKQEEWRIFSSVWHCFKAEHEDVRTFHTMKTGQEGEGTHRFTGEIKE